LGKPRKTWLYSSPCSSSRWLRQAQPPGGRSVFGVRYSPTAKSQRLIYASSSFHSSLYIRHSSLPLGNLTGLKTCMYLGYNFEKLYQRLKKPTANSQLPTATLAFSPK
jgi:hypothetical protein